METMPPETRVAPGSSPRHRERFAAALPWLLLLAGAADWLALRTGRVEHPTWVLAGLVAAAMLAMVVRLALVLVALSRRRRPRVAGAAEMLLLAGLLTALAGGLTNWLMALQGFVVLYEGERVPLTGGSHLQALEGGPWARIDEMSLELGLEEVELVDSGGGFFYPRSHLFLDADGGEPIRLETDLRTAASAGPLRFHQGAFGFAPRIVLLREGKQVFDRVVPFTTERRSGDAISFAGDFTLAAEALEVHGSVDLRTLDEGLRGHATLELAITRDGDPLGRGRLAPGHFADIAEGYRVGFAGLKKWSEIDISRRSYGEVVRVGAVLALAGGLLWPLAAWRRW